MPSPSPVPRKAAPTPPQHPALDLNALYAHFHPMDRGPVKEERPLFQIRATDLAVPKVNALRAQLSWTHSRQPLPCEAELSAYLADASQRLHLEQELESSGEQENG